MNIKKSSVVKNAKGYCRINISKEISDKAKLENKQKLDTYIRGNKIIIILEKE